MSLSISKILIIAPSWIGDTVMAGSLLKAIKALNADTIIDVIAMDWTKDLLSRMSEINKIITMPVGHGIFGWNTRKKLGHTLRGKCYDQAIILPNSWKSALIPWFANIPLRTGWRGEMRYGLLNDVRLLDKKALPMMVQRYVSLAYPSNQSCIAPHYTLPHITAKSLPANFALPPSPSKNRLIFCPGAEFGPAKCWPATRYAELANKLLKQNWQLVILGAKADCATADAIVTGIKPAYQANTFNLCGKTTLNDAIDVLATADTIVCNDSGLMHIAAALHKPLIAIYGPTSPAFTPPLTYNANIMQLKVDCGPCFQRTCPQHHHHCMQDITSEQIIRLINKKVPCTE